MNTFILQGGKTLRESKQNDEFYSEFSSIPKNEINILLCYWARDREK